MFRENPISISFYYYERLFMKVSRCSVTAGLGFPLFMAQKQDLKCRKNAEKGAHMKTPIKDLGRELLSNGGVSQTDLILTTGLPSWKISRIFKRLELLKFIEVEKEPRFTRGRPRKVGKLTQKGVEYFTSLLGEVREEDGAGSCASSAPAVRGGEGNGS